MIFPIQDVYKIDSKRISVGRVEAGVIRTGQEIKILPSEKITKVKSIEKFLEETDVAFPGESIGVTLEDPLFLDRGNVICQPGKEPTLTDTFKASIFWMAKEDFNKDEKLILRCATQETLCKVEKIEKRINSSDLKVIEEDADKLKELEAGEVTIKTKKPIAVTTFNETQELGRCVFVRGENICAGSIITAVNLSR